MKKTYYTVESKKVDDEAEIVWLEEKFHLSQVKLACVAGAKRGGGGGGGRNPPPFSSLSPTPFDACFAG